MSARTMFAGSVLAALAMTFGVGASEAILSTDNFKAAVLIKKVDARPPKAGLMGFQGATVRACFMISIEGEVKDITFPDEGRQKFFDSSIRRALVRWRYTPALRDGQPVEQPECVYFDIRAIGG